MMENLLRFTCVLTLIVLARAILLTDPENDFPTQVDDGGLLGEELMCNAVGDVVFLMDASSSLSDTDYEQEKHFIKALINSFNVGPDAVRVGLAAFNRYVTVTFQLNQITQPGMSPMNLTDLVDEAAPIALGTLTHKGLKTVQEEMFTEANGDRPSVPNIVVVVTDGRASNQEKTAIQSSILRQSGATVFAVSVGRWNSDTQLQVLASKPVKDFRFSVKNFPGLDRVLEQLSARTCEVLENRPEILPECIAKTDLLFIIDASSSITRESFEKAKEYVIELLQSFIISQDFVRVSVMTFDYRARISFYLDSHRKSTDVTEAIMELKQVSTGTLTDRALAAARSEVFNPIRGDRPEVPNVAILLSDGNSRFPQKTLKEANLLKEFGTTLFTIGIGKQKITELETIASLHPHTEHVLSFPLKDFDQLRTITPSLVQFSCEVSAEVVPSFTCEQKLDIVFVLDVSRTLKGQMMKLRNLVMSIVGGYKLHTDYIRVGIISYNRKASLDLKLSEGINVDAIKAALESLTKPRFVRMTWKALDLLRTDAFNPGNGGRVEATKIAIVINNGNSRKFVATMKAAKLVHESGITTFLLTGSRRILLREAKAIASSPPDFYSYYVKTFDGLFSFISMLQQRTCSVPSTAQPA